MNELVAYFKKAVTISPEIENKLHEIAQDLSLKKLCQLKEIS